MARCGESEGLNKGEGESKGVNEGEGDGEGEGEGEETLELRESALRLHGWERSVGEREESHVSNMSKD